MHQAEDTFNFNPDTYSLEMVLSKSVAVPAKH